MLTKTVLSISIFPYIYSPGGHVSGLICPLDYLHDRGLKLLREGQALGHVVLGQITDECYEVAHAVPRVGRGGHQGDVLPRILILVE